MKNPRGRLLSRMIFPSVLLLGLIFRLNQVREVLSSSDKLSLYLDAVLLFAVVFFAIRLMDSVLRAF